MKMERSGRSGGFGDNGTLPWPSCWEENEGSSSISGLNIEHSRELSHLVEDQEIAAQAVAFVVNSSRKGIVPLCADVAHIMRSKRSLEHKLARLRGENEALRSSLSASSCTSPTPASITSYEHRTTTDRNSPCLCSRCSSQCSSLLSNSPKLFHQSRSPRLPQRSSAFSAVPGVDSTPSPAQAVAALVHPPPATDAPEQVSPPTKVKGHRRKNSLPEMVSEPHGNVPKISPRIKQVSTEVQCSLESTETPNTEVVPEPECSIAVSSVSTTATSSPTLEQQFKETLQVNARISEELSVARREILQLQAKLKDSEMKQQASRQCPSDIRFHVESETREGACCPRCSERICGGGGGKGRESPPPPAQELHGTGARLKTPSPVMIRGYLPGCKCSSCEKYAMGSSPHKLKKSTSGSSVQIELEDHVVVKGEKTGVVKYVGHLDNVAAPQANMLFVGVELDVPGGQHSGVVNGKRYFTCARDCGHVLPLSDVLCVLSKQQPPSPSRCPSYKHASSPALSSKTSLSPPLSRPPPPRIFRSLSERVERGSVETGCVRKKQRPSFKGECRYLPAQPQNLKLPKDDKLSGNHLV